MRKRWIAVSLCVLAATIASSCKTTASDAPLPDAALDESGALFGRYELVTIEGKAIPYAPIHLGRRMPTVEYGDLVFDANGSFTSEMRYLSESGQSWSREFAGTYRTEPDRYVLKWKGAGRTAVTLENETLTMNNEGMLFVYEKAGH